MSYHANIQKAAGWLGCEMSNCSTELQKAIAIGTLTHRNTLFRRQALIQHLRANPAIHAGWEDSFQEIATIEREIAPFFEETSKDKEDLQADAIAQLSFQHPLLKPINHVPFAVAVVALFKVWAVPIMTVLTPILAWILPYILLKFVYSLPINQDQYAQILQGMWSGNLSNPREAAEKGISSLWSGRSITQMILFGFSFLQGMIQPIQNAMHLYQTDSTIHGIGKKLIRIRNFVKLFRDGLGDQNGTHVKLSYTLDALSETDYRGAFMLVKDQPDRLRIALRDLARLEIMWRMSQKEELQAVEFYVDQFVLEGVTDLSLEGGGVRSRLDLSGAGVTHAVLTGPNGGGKSSFLRAVLQSVLLGHTYGFAPARAARMPLFSWIASGLQLRDTPGVLSMFETEVKFAADCLRMSRKATDPTRPGLILFDELFHSTNPPDGIRTAKTFLEKLWGTRPEEAGVYSIVSTHVFSLIETAPKNVVPICCSAERTETGDIHYSYRVEPGVCRVSSVDKVWERFGLSAGKAAARPVSDSQTLSNEENHAN